MKRIIDRDIAWVRNQHYSSQYNEEELKHFDKKEVGSAYTFQHSYDGYAKTPLYQLRNLANYLGVADIRVKDESYRFGLNAFKVLGGIYAIARFLAERLEEKIEELSFDLLKSSDVKERLGELTFITATDGNHGRGVAWAAREFGHQSIVYMPKGSSEVRLNAIRNEGAQAEITDLNYDECVRMCANLAKKNGWIMVQDTAWKGYEHIPLWVMQGYASLAKEIVNQLESNCEEQPTHIFLQAGVGSFAGAITAYMVQHYRKHSPIIIVVEPEKADCYYRSFSTMDGTMEFVTDDMDTIMAGLACGEPNPRAFRILQQYSRGAFSCNDNITALGMRVYGNPLGDDPRIVSGESGAVTLGLLYYLRKLAKEPKLCQEILLDSESRVLLISTEGDTDPYHYRKIVWEGHYPVTI